MPQRIKQHDANRAIHILKDIDDYLNSLCGMNTIGTNSLIHQDIKDFLSDIGVKKNDKLRINR